MSRDLEISVEASSIQRTSADLVAVPLFEDERPLRGSAGHADWRLCGKLSALAAKGEVVGRPGEAVLMATFGGLRSPLLLVLGAGWREHYDARACQALAQEATRRALALRVGSLALPFADTGGGSAAQELRAAALVAGAATAVGRAEEASQLQLRLLVPREEAVRAADLLRRARSGRLPPGVTLRLPAAAAPAAASSPGISTPRGSQLVK
jgi:hypothetical protein